MDRGLIAFERTSDYELVGRILRTPRCWERMADDAAPQPADFHAGPIPGLEYILARVDGEPAGLFLLAGNEVHFCLLPGTWGQTERIARAFLAWVWTNTEYTRLVGPIPSHNRLALRLAQAVGFVQVGLRRGGTKNGRPFDLILTEMKRP